jgi:integrase
METVLSVASKLQLEEYIITDGLNQEMLDTMTDYLMTLHSVSESSKYQYLERLRRFGLWLVKNGIRRFVDVKKADIDRFLSTSKSPNTINAYITVFKPFYREFLGKSEIAKGLKFHIEDIQPITPSEVLTPHEVITIAEQAGQRREMYKVIILSLFESCARVNELLHLKLGDVQFHSVTDKEGHRKLIARLYFKRSKGKVSKQPVTLIMFASELKRARYFYPVLPSVGDLRISDLIAEAKNPETLFSSVEQFSFLIAKVIVNQGKGEIEGNNRFIFT